MDYTDIDPVAAVDALMAENYAEYLWKSFAQKLDAEALYWCSELAKFTSSGDLGASALTQSESAVEKHDLDIEASEKFKSKIVDEKTIKAAEKAVVERKADWLPQYIKQVETEHAQHTALAEFCDSEGNKTQGDVHRRSILRCEAAQRVALSALKEING